MCACVYLCMSAFTHARIHTVTRPNLRNHMLQVKRAHAKTEPHTRSIIQISLIWLIQPPLAFYCLPRACLRAPTHVFEQIPHCIVRPVILNHLQAKFSPKLSSFCLTETWFKLEPFKFFHYSPVSTQACQTDSMIHTPLTLIVFGRNFCSGWHSAAHAWGWLSGSVCACGAPPLPTHTNITVAWWKPPQICLIYKKKPILKMSRFSFSTIFNQIVNCKTDMLCFLSYTAMTQGSSLAHHFWSRLIYEWLNWMSTKLCAFSYPVK